VQPLLHRAALGRPLSLLKYAMTLDGKIATYTGHSTWVSGPACRARVFEMRARSDCVIVGGNTVRRDNPRLTTRRESGHQPARIVMSRTLDLPDVRATIMITHTCSCGCIAHACCCYCMLQQCLHLTLPQKLQQR
jgi:riboflavin-specific deaminase-like protein